MFGVSYLEALGIAFTEFPEMFVLTASVHNGQHEPTAVAPMDNRM